MNITSVKVMPVHNNPRLKAFVSIVIDSCLAIHNLKIIQKDQKMFISMPNKPHKNQKLFKDIVHPLNAETRQLMEKTIFEVYHKVTSDNPSQSPARLRKVQ